MSIRLGSLLNLVLDGVSYQVMSWCFIASSSTTRNNLQEWIMRPKYHETCCEYKNLSALSCLAHFFQMTELAIKLVCVNLGFVVHLLKFSQGIISFASLYAHTARLGCNHVCPCMHEYSNYERSTMKTMKDPPRKLAEIILAPKY